MRFKGILLVVLLLCCAFDSADLNNLLLELQSTLTKSLRISSEINIAKTKLEVTPTGFVRFTKTLKSGKQCYSSLNLSKFFKMDYWGTTDSGLLILRSARNDVIVQTFHDQEGDVDSMSSHLDILLNKIEPEQLNAINYQLKQIKASLLQKL